MPPELVEHQLAKELLLKKIKEAIWEFGASTNLGPFKSFSLFYGPDGAIVNFQQEESSLSELLE